MLIAILAPMVVFLGVTALAALIVKMVTITFKKFVSLIKEKLTSKFGGTLAIMDIRRVAKEAIKEAERTGNKKNVEQLEKMMKQEGFAMAVQDKNGNISADDIEIYEAEQMDPNIYGEMDEDGLLVVGN